MAVFVRRNAQILVIHHHRLNTWLPIGGEMEMGETPLEAARRELLEETGLVGVFPEIVGACDGVPAGYLGYEEHQAGSKGMHMNFVFLADVEQSAEVTPNHEFSEYRWLSRDDIESLECPLNVRQYGYLALDALSTDSSSTDSSSTEQKSSLPQGSQQKSSLPAS